ncbi:MAG TPA: polymer-forming cytoskeletal protein, partial [Firmicutes bacterium]|nr:polymer-forming cytoskeletal protein [Bacillota bacterium]
MKKLKWAVLLSLALLMLAGGAAARENVIEGDINKAAGSLEIPRGTTVNGNVIVNMGEVEILGMVNGNVESNMGRITVHGEVNGGVEANMGQVLIIGSVSGDVEARMGEVIVEGAVGGNVDAELGAVRVRGTVAGDVDSGLGELRIPGEVLGNVTSRGKNVIITGTVRGDVTLVRGIVELGPESEVGGRVYIEQGMVKVAGGARAGSVEVGEELSEAEIDRMFRSNGYHFRGLDDFEGIGDILEAVFEGIGRAFSNVRLLPRVSVFREGWRIFPLMHRFGWPGHVARGLLNMVVLFALAALTFSLFPRHVQSAGQAVFSQTGAVIGWGLLAVVLAVPLMLL